MEVLISFRWAQVSLEYICEPNRPAFELLSVLDRIPRELNDFYFKLLSEVKEDNSDFNQATGIRAIALLLATTDLKMGLKTEDFVKIVLADMDDERAAEKVGVDGIRVACHHLVVRDEVTDTFDFGHFSVAEFFHADQRTNKHHKEVRRDFCPEGVWRHVSVICANRIDILSKTGQLWPASRRTGYLGAGNIPWGLFSRNLNARGEGSLALPTTHLQNLRLDPARPTGPTKTAIVSSGVDLFSFDPAVQWAFVAGSSFVVTGNRISHWLIDGGRGWSGTNVARAIYQVDPSSTLYVAKVCEHFDDVDSIDAISQVSTISTNQVRRC